MGDPRTGPSPTVALLGSGEFEPWAREVDRWVLERARDRGRVLVLPTASAPEGEDVFERWAALGVEHYQRQGVTAEVLPLRTREDAERPELARELSRASMVFFSGGNPAYLARVLDGTEVWRALRTELLRGLGYAGCSAGVACLGESAPDSSASVRARRHVSAPGVRLFRGLDLGPHWDALDTYLPGLRQQFVRSLPPGRRLLAVDEHTAVVGDGRAWAVLGRSAAHLFAEGTWRDFPAGSTFEMPLLEAVPE